MIFKKKKKHSEGIGKIIVGEGVSLRYTEGYNRLRDNVLYMNADGQKKLFRLSQPLRVKGKQRLFATSQSHLV